MMSYHSRESEHEAFDWECLTRDVDLCGACQSQSDENLCPRHTKSRDALVKRYTDDTYKNGLSDITFVIVTFLFFVVPLAIVVGIGFLFEHFVLRKSAG